MSELMAKALFLIGQGMHGRKVTIRATKPTLGVGIETLDCGVALHVVGKWIDVFVNGDRIDTSDDAEVIAGAAIAHLLGIGTSEES